MYMMKSAVFTASVLISGICPAICPAQEINDTAIFLEESYGKGSVMPRPDTVSLIFLGDVMLHARQIEESASRYASRHGETDAGDHYAFDFSAYFEDIQDSVSGADLAVANMEFTLGGPPFTGYPAFSAPDGYAGYLAGCGIDIFLTANNHILDRGKAGVIRTMGKYAELGKSAGIMSTGTSVSPEQFRRENPLTVDTCGMRISFVNFTYGTNVSVPGEYPKVNRAGKGQIGHLMHKAEENGADLTVVLPHWGEEYSTAHSEAQHEQAAWLAENGADIIIGTHPHVVQDTATIKVALPDSTVKEVPVVYSLGNSVSNMSAPYTQIGLMVKVRAVKLMNRKVKILPIEYTYLWCSLPGRLKDTHTTIPVKAYIGKRHLWKMPYEYDKMIDSYLQVKRLTGIQD